ncbi:MAG: ring-1,2-phenylacetyl-CoA epoxidase subunit PaaC [Glaciecola sp.]|jgi:ring-1,2-phenylacetyl-CoA epoxidase subunit PaaC
MGDNSLILGHRLSEYCSKGPFLEEDLAISNVGLDHLGQSEAFLDYAAKLSGNTSADHLAFRRVESEYLNVQLVEAPAVDFGIIMAKQFYMDVFNYYLYTEMRKSSDDTLSAIAEKSLKEVTYHLRRSADWIKRLGDGTEESHLRIQEALNDLWLYTGELFEKDEVELELASAGIVPNVDDIKPKWLGMINEVLSEATLTLPEGTFMQSGGRVGHHTEGMGFILTDMQYLNRVYPDAKW